MPSVIGIVQARMGSTRLPGKLLAELAGGSVLEVLRTRTAAAAVDEWWVATTALAEDDVVVGRAAALGMRTFRGDPQDVLSRFVAIVRERAPDLVVRLTGDNPYVDAAIVDRLVASAARSMADHVGEAADDRSLPLGYCPEAVRATALLEADAATHDQPHHRSHVTSWLRAEGRSRALDLPADWPRRPEWRWTIDTTADLEAARAAFALFGGAWPQIGYPDMVARLEGHPEVVAINAGVRQKLLSEG